MGDQATGLRDFVAQQNAEADAHRARLQSYRDEFDRLTDPHSSEPYRDKYGNIVVDVAPKVREGFDEYQTKLSFARVRAELGVKQAETLARFKGGV